MIMKNMTLTAVAALAVALAGGAVAQDSTTPATELSAPVTTTQQDSSTPATAPAAEPDAIPEPEASEPEAAAPAEDAADQDTVTTAEPEAEAEPEAVEPATTEPEAEEQAEVEAPEAEATETEAAEPEAQATEAEAEVEAPEAAEQQAPPAEEEAEDEIAITTPHIEDIAFSFEGPFGKFDQHQLQRGLQVYTEVCAACHGLRYVPLRTLSDPNGPGLPDDQVKAYAAELTPIMDPETEEERARLTTDHFPTVSGMGMGPDLSLMAKARAGFHGPYGTGVAQLFRGTGGPEYLHAILVSYDGETKDEAGATLYHNTAFDGNWIQMPEPLMEDMVEYEDGTPATVDQMARDVSAFLMWTAEPKMMDRKQVGLISVLFMIVLAALLYLTNKRLWWPIKHRDNRD